MSFEEKKTTPLFLIKGDLIKSSRICDYFRFH